MMKGIEGSTLGRYELRRRVAQGGMSEVYLGYDRRVKRWVAVKVLYGRDEPFIRRFEREALAVGALSHDNILPLYDFGEQRPWYYLVMPYVEGGTLRDYLLKRERLSLEEAGSFLDQMASALQHAHDHNVVHRDVKPSNILLRLDGHAYLVDFGLAKARMEAESLTHAGAMVGTPEYMAPEQSNGMNDYRSDIYSLGIILYQMLTGRVPFTAESPVAISLKHIQTPPIPPGQFNNDLPQSIEDVILKALEKDPDNRYQEARAVSTAYWQALQYEVESRHSGELLLALPQGGFQAEDVQNAEVEIETTRPITHPLPTPFDLSSTKPHHIPLGVEVESLLLTPATPQKARLKRFLFLALFFFALLGLIIPLNAMWQIHNDPAHSRRVSNSLATHTAQQQETATAITQANLQASLAAQARVQATAGITSAIGEGKSSYYNAMTGDDKGWINDGRQCHFSPQGYHVHISLPHAAAWCYTNQQQIANGVITAQAELLYGGFCGLVFRLNPKTRAFYVLELDSHSNFRFQRALGRDPSRWLTLIDWTHSNALRSGYGQINTFLVIMAEDHFRFYINRQLITLPFSDPASTTYSSGLVGFMVGGDAAKGTDAVFSNLELIQQ